MVGQEGWYLHDYTVARLLVSAATPDYRRINAAFEICSTSIVLLSEDCVRDSSVKCEVCG